MTAALVTAARFETEERVRRYPALVASGKFEAQAAEDDTEAWDTIADALERDISISAAITARRGPGVGCYQLRAALDQAIATRTAACTKHPDDTALAARRDAVLAIDAHFRRTITFWCDLNDELRARANQPLERAA